MIKLKCTCGATIKIIQQWESDERFVDDWLTQHKPCREEYWIARHENELESGDNQIKDNQIKVLRRDIAFYRNCLNSGEMPEDGAEPSAQPWDCLSDADRAAIREYVTGDRTR
ncbi:MAG: hypothetical protein GY814_01745 [Gammaproteobacteria bacterium]|nr:hypothetical protein [Gammaproteobacteria bacterium]